MKLVLATALVASASAFTSSQANVRTSALAASPYAEELGAMKPVRLVSACLVLSVCVGGELSIVREARGRVQV
jgi:hypothetical protein